jgi:hypothetical protein
MSTKHRPTIMIDGKEYPDVRVGDVWMIEVCDSNIIAPPIFHDGIWMIATYDESNGYDMWNNPDNVEYILTRDGKPYDPPAPTLPVDGERCVIDGREFCPVVENSGLWSFIHNQRPRILSDAPSLVLFAGYYYPSAGDAPGAIMLSPWSCGKFSTMNSGIIIQSCSMPTHVVFRMESSK